jgi:hypothetical protein
MEYVEGNLYILTHELDVYITILFYFSMLITFSERSWLEQGHEVGENVVPLARNFNNWSEDIEADNIPKVSYIPV